MRFFAIFLACMLSAQQIEAGCGQFFRQSVVVQHQAIAANVVAVPQVSYFVGAPIRIEAIVARAIEADPEYAAFKRWKLEQQQPQRESIQVQPAYPLLAARCARCHSGDEPKGGLTLDGSKPVPAEAALKSLRFLRDRKGPDEMAAVLAGLKDADLPGLMQELLEASK